MPLMNEGRGTRILEEQKQHNPMDLDQDFVCFYYVRLNDGKKIAISFKKREIFLVGEHP